MTLDEAELRHWVGNTEERADQISLASCLQMSATVGHEQTVEEGGALPPLWHWMFFQPVVTTAGLGQDGHARLGGFLPPVALPRRMWAGGRLNFTGSLLVGIPAQRHSLIKDVARKSGRSGELCFVTVQHTYTQQGSTRLIEEHDIVYREAAGKKGTGAGIQKSETPTAMNTAAVRASGALTNATSARSLRVTPSVTALFRYSALTFNSHRIHYDRYYCLHEEHYDGLVFHGPLTATLMAGLAQSYASTALKSFDFRALAPLLDTEDFDIEADWAGPVMSVAARKADGQVAMQASATF